MAEDRDRTFALMRMAVDLLGRHSEALGAARLQHAIDAVDGV